MKSPNFVSGFIWLCLATTGSYADELHPDSLLEKQFHQQSSEIKVDLSELVPGSLIERGWGEWRVYIYRRTALDVEYLQNEQDLDKVNQDEKSFQDYLRHNYQTINSLRKQILASAQPEFDSRC